MKNLTQFVSRKKDESTPGRDAAALAAGGVGTYGVSSYIRGRNQFRNSDILETKGRRPSVLDHLKAGHKANMQDMRGRGKTPAPGKGTLVPSTQAAGDAVVKKRALTMAREKLQKNVRTGKSIRVGMNSEQPAVDFSAFSPKVVSAVLNNLRASGTTTDFAYPNDPEDNTLRNTAVAGAGVAGGIYARGRFGKGYKPGQGFGTTMGQGARALRGDVSKGFRKTGQAVGLKGGMPGVGSLLSRMGRAIG